MTRRTVRPMWAWGILVVAITCHGFMLISLHTRTLNPLFNDTYNRPGPAADFFSVYHAGRQVVTGGNPYLADEEPRITPEFAPYRYPPGVAYTLGVVVAGVKPWVAYGLWLIVLEMLLLLNLVLIGRVVDNARHRDVVTACWLVFTPLYVELWMGQFTFATVTLLFYAVVAWRQKRPRVAAAAWAIASSVKLFGLAFVPWLVRQRRFGTLAVGAGVLCASLLWFIGRPADWELFVRLNFTEVDLQSFHAGNFGLQALVYEIVGPLSPSQWRPIGLLLSLILLGSATAAMAWHRDADDRITAALVLLLLPLVSKHAWEHHYVVTLPAMTLLVAAWAERRRLLVMLGVIYGVLWLPSPLVLMQSGGPTWHPEQTWSSWARILYHAPKPLAALTLFGVCVVFQLRRHSSQAPTSSGL